MESETLQVLYDYSYEYKEKKISIVHDEKLKLLQRTNQHWWKVVRPNHNRPFFVPASYVQTISTQEEPDSSPSPGTGRRGSGSGSAHGHGHGHRHETPSNEPEDESSDDEDMLSVSSPSAASAPPNRQHGFGLQQQQHQRPQPFAHQNLRGTTSTFLPPTATETQTQLPQSSSPRVFRIQHSPSLKVSSPRHHHHPDANGGGGGGSMSMKMKRADSSRNSKRALKVKNWSASLEELSKQIVFPGLSSESVMNLSGGSGGGESGSPGSNQEQSPEFIRIVGTKVVTSNSVPGPQVPTSGTGSPGTPVSTNNAKPVPLPRRNVVTELQQQNSSSPDSFTVSSPKPIPKTRSKGQLNEHDTGGSTSSASKSSGGSSEILNSSCEELDNEVLLAPGNSDQYNYAKDQDKGPHANVNADSKDQRDQNQEQSQSGSDMKPKQVLPAPHAQAAATIVTIPSFPSSNTDRTKSVSTDSINSATGSITTVCSGSGSFFGAATGTTTSGKQPSSRPTPPSAHEHPLRLLLDNWAEYVTAEGRHYYYNNVSGASSWKPPRINSLKADGSGMSPPASATTVTGTTGRTQPVISYHHNGSSGGTSTRVIVTGENHSQNNYYDKFSATGQRNQQKQSQSKQVLEEHEEDDRERERGGGGKAHAQVRVRVTQSSASGSASQVQNQMQQSQSQSSQLPVPDGYSCQVDTITGQVCYINELTGAKWFSSQDPAGKIYYYEENSAKSSWFLPVPGISVGHGEDGSSSSPLSKSTTSDSLEGRETTPPKSTTGASSHIPMPDVVNTLGVGLGGGGGGVVKKRYSTGDVADRSLKARSLIILDPSRKGLEPGKIASLPRSPQKSIWNTGFIENDDEECGSGVGGGPLVVLKEGSLSRTRITENGKKVRKNWSTSYVVLTEHHLSLFKDHKSFANTTTRKSEMEIELVGVNLGWAQDKSSRKNVFQLNTSADFQILFQCDDKDAAGEWFEKIAEVIDGQESDYTLRLRSASPDTFLDAPIGEKKGTSSRLGRAKSTKVKISGSVENLTSEERSKIRAQLKKFFNRRPPRESLVKKGIYKDEAVFGCHLEKLCTREEGHVPRFVQECIRAIESKEENLKTDGIYRASGNLSQVQKLRLQVDQNNLTCLYQEEDVHVLAGSLKLFFREMKEPLIPSDLFDKALAASNLQNRKERMSRFRDLVLQLAKPNRATLCYLLRHLLKVAEYTEFNRMQIPNLAIVFGPTLMWPAQESTNMALDLMRQNFVIEALLQDYEAVFEKK